MTTALPRIVELVRVSTDSQRKDATHETQLRELERLRTVRPGVLIRKPIEALGVSGAKGVAERPDLQELFRLAKAKAFDELRVFSIDRLTRSDDLRERAAIFGAVADAGAVIVDVNQRVINPADDGMGELDYLLQTMFAARERKKIAQRTIAGKKRKAAEGRMVHGIPPYGRSFNKEAGQWELVPVEVEIYRRIIDSYLSGSTLWNIAKALNAEGVPSKRDRWGYTTIQRLLRSPTIVGTYRAFGHAMQIPSIVTLAEWESIKATLAQRRSRPLNTKAIEALLRGRLFCEACGLPVWVQTSGSKKGQARYACAKPCKREIPCPDRRSIAVTQADALVRDALLEMVRRPEIFERALRDGTGVSDDPKKELKALEAELVKLASREAKTLKLFNEDLLSEPLAKSTLAEIRTARTRAEERRAALRAVAPEAAAQGLEELRAELLEAVKQATPARLRELVAILRPRVTLGADGLDISGLMPVGDENRPRPWSGTAPEDIIRDENRRRSSADFVPHDIPFKLRVALKISQPTKLSAEQVADIRRRVAAGASQKDIGAVFGITQPVVSRLVNGKRRPPTKAASFGPGQ